jgi:glycosyltransferase involved in cell wall biosynthesis
MNVLICTETLSAGGAEIFLMNWASYANQNGIKTSILCFHSRLDKKESIQKHLTNTDVYYPYKNKKWDLFIAKLDSLISKVGINYSFRTKQLNKRIRSILKKESINIVHSHLFPADLIVSKSKLPEKVKHFTTIHGDYLRHFYTAKEDRKVKNFEEKLALITSSLSGVIVICEKQVQFFHEEIKWTGKIKKIYNGFSIQPPEAKTNSDKFIVGMVSRGIKEKGWKEACESFIQANIKNSELLLVGESQHLNDLKEEYAAYENIQFLGYHPNPPAEIRKFDIALLPSYYGSESLPTVLIEYFYCGVPVIASNIGEIPQMMCTDKGNAGILIENNLKPVSIEKLSKAMIEIYRNENDRNQYKLRSRECAKKFNIENCVRDYLGFYKS